MSTDELILVWAVVTIAGMGIILWGLTVLSKLSGLQAELARESRRLAAIDRKFGAVMNNLGITEPEPEMPAVVNALERGNKIDAVKAYMDATGTGLADAKAAVEEIARRRSL